MQSNNNTEKQLSESLKLINDLIFSVRHNEISKVKALLEAKASIHCRVPPESNTLLHEAAYFADENMVKLLLDAKASPHAKNIYGDTPFMLAAEKNENSALTLLEAKAGIETQNDSGNTALMFACVTGKLKLAKQLLESKAILETKNNSGSTALMLAIGHRKDDFIDYFLQKGALTHWAKHPDGETLNQRFLEYKKEKEKQLALEFVRAISRGDENEVKRLIEQKTPINHLHKNNTTALHYAAFYKDCPSSTVRLLLDAKAFLDPENNEGDTPLLLASIYHETAGLALVEAKADVNIQNATKNTALMFACENGRKQLAKQLIDRKANLDLKNDLGLSSLMIALGHHEYDIVTHLLQHGAKTDWKHHKDEKLIDQCFIAYTEYKRNIDSDDRTQAMAAFEKYLSVSLVHAVSNNNEDKVKQLINEKASVQYENQHGESALHYAAYHKNCSPYIAKLLVDAKADINATNIHGLTPLHFSCSFNEDVGTYLVDAKASLDNQDSTGNTALMYACKNKYTQIAKNLIVQGARLDLENKDKKIATDFLWKNQDFEMERELIKVSEEYGQLALLHAISSNRAIEAKRLVEEKVSININLPDENTLIHYAASCPDDNIVKILIDAKASFDKPNKFGTTPLLEAAAKNNNSAFHLLEAKASANSLNNTGNTALMYACEKNNTRLAIQLINAKADLTCKNQKGNSALMIAVSHKFKAKEIVQYLLLNGAIPDWKNHSAEIALTKDLIEINLLLQESAKGQARPTLSAYAKSLDGTLNVTFSFPSQRIINCLVDDGTLPKAFPLEKKFNQLKVSYKAFEKLTQTLSCTDINDSTLPTRLAHLLWKGSNLECWYKQQIANEKILLSRKQDESYQASSPPVAVETLPITPAPMRVKRNDNTRKTKADLKREEIEKRIKQRNDEKQRAQDQSVKQKQIEENKRKQHQKEWQQTQSARKAEELKLQMQRQQESARQAELLKQKMAEEEKLKELNLKGEIRRMHLRGYATAIMTHMRAIGTYGMVDRKEEKDYQLLNTHIKHFALLYNLARCYMAISSFKSMTRTQNDTLAKEAKDMRNMIMHGATETQVNSTGVDNTIQNLKEVLPMTFAKLNQPGPSSRFFKQDAQPIVDLFGKDLSEISLASIEDNPQYKELSTFFAGLKTTNIDEKGSKQAQHDKYIDWVTTKMIPLINRIMSPISKLSLEILNNNARLRELFGEQLDALKMLFSMIGEYSNHATCKLPKAIRKFLKSCHELRNAVGHEFPDIQDNELVVLGSLAKKINEVLLPIPCPPGFSVSLRIKTIVSPSPGA